MLLFLPQVELKLEVYFSLQVLTFKKSYQVAQSATVINHHSDSMPTPSEL